MMLRARPLWLGARPLGLSAVSLLIFSGVALGCEQSRTLGVLDPRPQNLGGADDGTSTGGVDGQGPQGTGGDMGPVTLIDDLADCNALILKTAGREGSWYPFFEPETNPPPVHYQYGLPPDAKWGTQQCGIYLWGECPTCIAAGVGFELAADRWDLSSYSGIRVSFESETSVWSVIVTQGGTYSEYVELLPTGNMSAERVISFEDIYPDNGFEGLEYAREVQFTVGENDRGSFRLGIHRVELIE